MSPALQDGDLKLGAVGQAEYQAGVADGTMHRNDPKYWEAVAGSSMGPPGAGYAGLQTRAYAHPSMPAHHAVADCICEGLASV